MSAGSHGGPAEIGPRAWWLLLVIALGSVATILPSGTFNVAVPSLMRDFGLGHDSVQLVLTTYMATNTVAMLAAPWLIQRFGVRRTFEGSMALLIVTSAVAAFSQNFEMLLAARLAQGITPAILTPMGPIVLMRTFPPSRQGRAFGIHSLSVTLALAVAPAIGGLLVDHWGWRAVALLPIPAALLVWAAGLRLIPREDRSDSMPFDGVGMGLLSCLTLAWLTGLSRPASVPVAWQGLWLPLCGGVALLAGTGFVFHLRRARAPLVERALLRQRALLAGGGVNFLIGFGMYGAMYLMPVFLQEVIGLSASEAGAAQMPGVLALSLTFPVAGLLADRFDARHLIAAGLAVFATSFGLLWHFGAEVTVLTFIGVTVVGRMGQSFALTPVSKVSLAGLHGRDLSQGSMVLNYLRQLGGVLGVAGLAAFVAWRMAQLGGGAAAEAQAFAEGYLVVAACLFCAAAASRTMATSVA